MAEAEETVKNTRIRYVAEDHASEVARKIAQAYREPAEAVNRLKEKFREFRTESLLMVTSAAGIGFGLGSLIEKAREVHREFDHAKTGIASTLTTVLEWPKAVGPVERYQRAVALSSNITKELDDKATDLGSSLGEVSQAYKTIATATAPLHLSQEQLMDLTEKSTAAATRFGMSATAVADQVGRAMVTKTVRPFGELGIFLRENLGGNLKKLNNTQILEKFDKALSGSVDTARMMSEGVDGSIARIKSRVDEVVRGFTGPLYKEVARTIEDIYKKLKTTTDQGKPLIDVYGQKLVAVFREIKDVTGFIAEHWRAIALIWATTKVPAMFEGAAGLVGSLGNFKNPIAGIMGLKNLFAAGGGGVGGAGNILGVLGAATSGIGALASAAVVAGIALKGVYDEWQSRKKQAAELGDFFKEVGNVAKSQNYIRNHNAQLTPDQIEAGEAYVKQHAALAAEVLKQKGLLEDGNLNMERFNEVMASMSDDVRKNFMAMLPGAPDASSGLLGAYAAEVFRKAYQAPAAATAPDDTDRRTTGRTFNFFGDVNITQKFEDADPDRVAVRLKDDLENYSNRRTQSALAGAGGF